MNGILKLVAIMVIVAGVYTGVRYIGTVVHYACQVKGEDCPPPFKGLGDIAFIITGGNLVPLWTQK